jgi:hypothetical protein
MTTPTQIRDTAALDTRTLVTWLAAQQRRVLGILDGLDDQALRRAVLPSGWSCAGMVQHLTVMTQFWLIEVMTGIASDRPDGDDDFCVHDRPISPILENYKDQFQLAISLIQDVSLDTPPACWPKDLFGEWRLDNLLEVLLHVLIETTCHAGHLDAARELIDGRTWNYDEGRLSERPSPT